jgi:hypothetical protein
MLNDGLAANLPAAKYENAHLNAKDNANLASQCTQQL